MKTEFSGAQSYVALAAPRLQRVRAHPIIVIGRHPTRGPAPNPSAIPLPEFPWFHQDASRSYAARLGGGETQSDAGVKFWAIRFEAYGESRIFTAGSRLNAPRRFGGVGVCDEPLDLRSLRRACPARLDQAVRPE